MTVTSDWLNPFRRETEKIIKNTELIRQQNEKMKRDIERLRRITPEEISEIVKKSTRGTPDQPSQEHSTGAPDAL
jgi:hypothetical protein